MPEPVTLHSSDLLRPASSRQRRGPIEPVHVTVPSPTKSPFPTAEGYFKKQHLHTGHLTQLEPLPSDSALGLRLKTTPPRRSSNPALQLPPRPEPDKKKVDPLRSVAPAGRASSPPDKGHVRHSGDSGRPMSRRRVVPPVQPVQTPRPGVEGEVLRVGDGEAALLKSKTPAVNPNTLVLSPVHPCK